MKRYRKHVFVCQSYDCSSYGSEELLETFRQRLQERKLMPEIKITKSGCLKECQDGPIVVVYPEGVWYARVLLEDLDEIIDEHLVNGRVVERLVHYKME
jgi:NADP-reducing hydrogenase subunit HndC